MPLLCDNPQPLEISGFQRCVKMLFTIISDFTMTFLLRYAIIDFAKTKEIQIFYFTNWGENLHAA